MRRRQTSPPLRARQQPASPRRPPARRSSNALIASFLATFTDALRASAISTDAAASASGRRARRSHPAVQRSDRKRGDAREQWSRRVTVQRCTGEHDGVRACGLATHARCCGRLRKRALHAVERAGELTRTLAAGAVDRVTLEVRLDFRCGRFDPVVEDWQLACSLALLLSNAGRPGLRIFQGCEKCVFRLRDRAGEDERHSLNALAFRNRTCSATQTVAYAGLGRRPETCTKLGQDGVGQTADGDDSVGEPFLAAGFLRG